MKTDTNPFPLSDYYEYELFCDRSEEMEILTRNINNGVNTTIVSIRRLGKTALIHHLFNQLKTNNDTICIYFDAYPTQNLKDFTEYLASAVYKVLPEKKSVGKKFINLLKSLNFILSFNELSGQPEIHFDFTRHKQYEYSLAKVFEFLESQEKMVVIAIDEFQQISSYPEKNTEALLRSLIQNMKKTRFIFSGSHKHMMNEIFNNQKRPFFASSKFLGLGPIPADKYKDFIKDQFEGHKMVISDDAINFILEWTRIHTWYTQALCNMVFSFHKKNYGFEDVKRACDIILKENEGSYYQYRNLLTPVQWHLLKSIAKEGVVVRPNAGQFIGKYNLGTPSSVQRALSSLVNKEMVVQITDSDQNYYMVYDCFLSRWLESQP